MEEPVGGYHSLLAADIGAARTKVILVELVEGRYRFVARGTAPTTVGPKGVVPGLLQGLTELEKATGRRLSSRGGLISPRDELGAGVDAFVACTSLPDPLRVVVAAASRDYSLKEAVRAVGNIPAAVLEWTAPDGGLEAGRPRRWTGARHAVTLEDPQARLSAFAPEALVLAGGVDNSAGSGVLALAEAISRDPGFPSGLPVIYAGDRSRRQEIAQALGPGFAFLATGNVLPQLGTPNGQHLAAALGEIYRRRKLPELPGFGPLSQWASAPVESTAEALGRGWRFLAQRYGQRVLGLDVGHRQITVGLAQAGAYRCLVTQRRTAEQKDSGSSRLSAELSAVMRGMDLPGAVDLICLSGGEVSSLPYQAAALMALDAAEPVGLVRLALDVDSMLPQLGALASLSPLAAGQVMETDALLKLGTAIGVGGRARMGSTALKVEVQFEGQPGLSLSIPFGQLEMVPLGAGQRAQMMLRPGGALDVGLGRRGQAAVARVEGGPLGIILDCRGRPLPPSQ
ncbi:MAG: glutamate mutase L [Chloroflexota bacterium]